MFIAMKSRFLLSDVFQFYPFLNFTVFSLVFKVMVIHDATGLKQKNINQGTIMIKRYACVFYSENA